MYSFQVKKRDYLKISMILGIMCVGGMFISLYLYDEIVNKIIRWVNKQESIKKDIFIRNFLWKIILFGMENFSIPEKTFQRIFFQKKIILSIFFQSNGQFEDHYLAKCIWNYHFHWFSMHTFSTYSIQRKFKMEENHIWKKLGPMFFSE